MGLIGAGPVCNIEKPRAGRREVVITPEECARILGRVKVIMRESMVTSVQGHRAAKSLPGCFGRSHEWH